MGWVEDKAMEIVDDFERDKASVTIEDLVERAIRETLARAAEAADACRTERTGQLDHLLNEPADTRHALVIAKCSEAERIAAAIRKLGEP